MRAFGRLICLLAFAIEGMVAGYGAQVTLAWDASPDTSVTGYRLHYGGATRAYTNVIDVGQVTSRTVLNVVAGATYYFAVTAYNAAGLNSDFSTELRYTIPAVGTAPAISLTSPAAGASYSAPASVSLAASVTANGHTINKVQFMNGSAVLGEDTSSPYAYTWSNVPAGSYSLTARLVYDGSVTLNSAARSITVGSLPAISLTSPAAGASYSAPASVSLAASVTANGHLINKVQFLNGSTVLGEDTSSPYTYTWSNVPAGSYSLTARLVYDGSVTLNSAARSITVGSLPAISLTSPAAGASYTAPASVSLAASVTANGRSINKVQFLNGSTVLGEDTSSPYNYTWSNVSAGSYTLMARLVYDGSSTLNSASRSITVTSTSTSLPAPWRSVDLGTVGSAGSASASGGVYTIRGAGNLSGTADNLRFAYQTLTRGGEIRVRMNTFANTSSSARGGIMIRESLTPGSRYAFIGISPGGRFRYQYRSATSGSTTTISSSTVGTLPNIWLRLVREGSSFSGYQSVDGVKWTRLAVPRITMANSTLHRLRRRLRQFDDAEHGDVLECDGRSVEPSDRGEGQMSAMKILTWLGVLGAVILFSQWVFPHAPQPDSVLMEPPEAVRQKPHTEPGRWPAADAAAEASHPASPHETGTADASAPNSVDEIDSGVFPSAITWTVDGDPVPQEQAELMVRRWAEADPAAAAAWSLSLEEGPSREAALQQVAVTWANLDLASALDWIDGIAESEDRERATCAAGYEVARTDPVVALEIASHLAPSAARDDLLIHALSQWAGIDAQAVCDWALQIPEPALRERMVAAAAIGLAELDPEAAASLAADSLEEGVEQDRTAVAIVQRWAQSSPDAAAAWVAAFPEIASRDSAVENLLAIWTPSDAVAAGEWLNALPAGHLRSVAAETYLRALKAPITDP